MQRPAINSDLTDILLKVTVNRISRSAILASSISHICGWPRPITDFREFWRVGINGTAVAGSSDNKIKNTKLRNQQGGMSDVSESQFR